MREIFAGGAAPLDTVRDFAGDRLETRPPECGLERICHDVAEGEAPETRIGQAQEFGRKSAEISTAIHRDDPKRCRLLRTATGHVACVRHGGKGKVELTHREAIPRGADQIEEPIEETQIMPPGHFAA